MFTSCLFHVCVMVYAHCTWRHHHRNDAIFEFVHYDEIGGTAGGADTDDTVEQPETIAVEEEAAAQPEVPDMAAGENTPDLPEEEMPEEEELEPVKELAEIPEPELEIEPEVEVAVQEKPDPVIVDTPLPLLADKIPEEEPIELAEAPPRPKPRPKRQPSESSPPPAPPPSPLIVASVPVEAMENVMGGGGVGVGHGGSGEGSEVGNPDLLRVYAGEIQRRLGMYKQYPDDASKYNIEGMVVVTFTVNLDGLVRDIGMVESSGNVALDTEALSLPTRAAPFPRIPDVLRRQSITLTMPIQFSLH